MNVGDRVKQAFGWATFHGVITGHTTIEGKGPMSGPSHLIDNYDGRKICVPDAGCVLDES